MAGEDVVRAVPVLTGTDLLPMVAFWRRFGLDVTADFEGYVIMATDPTAEAAVEVHLAHWPDHDPRRAGAVYLRVRDAAALYERVRAELEAEGVLYLAPASGLTEELTAELRAMEDAGTPFVRLHELIVQDYGQLEFAVIDPAGWLVRVGSPAP
jgi:hypothetical protein